jgi:hypothetical protein
MKRRLAMPNYQTDTDGKTPLRMWSNARDWNGDFTSAIHLVHPVTGDSLCGLLKNSGVGFPEDSSLDYDQVISCKRCLKIAKP